ncbi:Transferrin binding protein B [Bibersteinia trehalosi USDA-ARS-USMARC-188]|uniref:Transferrin-binding protein B n=1 Tax=Bibersteinia trehalosi USDA-ARS-USMARC-188 TaxID=1263829 RepID=A0A4V7IAX4_BIBTR|nr:transferrin-binding protein-like solute binding protein [Bibersteinia trehalosi]AHG82195.1 Transferrin binding protein B [Bibersteinia trehalosi USDA-ARS-USMARC-188]
MFKLKSRFVLLNIALLSACTSNGGSFDVQSVKVESNKPDSPKPSLQDDNSSARRTINNTEAAALLQPGFGFSAKIPRRNQLPQANENTAPIGEITPIAGDLTKIPYEEEVKAYGYDDEGFSHTHDGHNGHNTRDFKFVRSGYVLHSGAKPEIKHKEVLRTGAHGYVYYLGTHPAKAMPAQKAIYKGYWDFTTDARKDRDSQYFSNSAGVNIGATPENSRDVNLDDAEKPMGHTGEFTADFSNKTLTGTLVRNGYVKPRTNEQKITPLYDINATIQGNRFSGKANARNTEDPYFGKDSSTLEGGFFGDNAQELAGKFLADDKSIFVVFAGKRDAQENDSERAFDALKVSLKDLSKSEMDTFGNATHLLINNTQIPLIAEGKKSFAEMKFDDLVMPTVGGKTYRISVCCNNLDYVKFGTYSEENDKDSSHLYLVGERTAVADLPSGKAQYRGTWNGIMRSEAGSAGAESPSNSESGTRSLFDVDFANKKINGKLIANDGVEERPMLTLEGEIKANGFAGTAKTSDSGFNLDPKSTWGGTVIHVDSQFEGAFYGKNALELGGIVHDSNSKDKVSITFAGKRQIEK